MLEMVCRQNTQQLLRPAYAEGRYQYGPSTFHDLRDFLDELLLKPISDRVILIERNASSDVENGRRANMIKMSMRENNCLHLLRRNMHWETHMMIDHHAII